MLAGTHFPPQVLSMVDQPDSAGRLKLLLTPKTKRGMKARAASLGLTLAAYVTRLHAADDGRAARGTYEGVRVWSSADGGWRER